MISPFVTMGYFTKFLSIKTASTEAHKDDYRQRIRAIAKRCKDIAFDIVRLPNKQYFPVLSGNNDELNVRFENVDIIKALKYVLVEEIETLIYE